MPVQTPEALRDTTPALVVEKAVRKQPVIVVFDKYLKVELVAEPGVDDSGQPAITFDLPSDDPWRHPDTLPGPTSLEDALVLSAIEGSKVLKDVPDDYYIREALGYLTLTSMSGGVGLTTDGRQVPYEPPTLSVFPGPDKLNGRGNVLNVAYLPEDGQPFDSPYRPTGLPD